MQAMSNEASMLILRTLGVGGCHLLGEGHSIFGMSRDKAAGCARPSPVLDYKEGTLEQGWGKRSRLKEELHLPKNV